MDYEIAGLPLHVLLVHAIVVLVPLLALLLVVIAAWPAARRVLWLPALIGAAVLLPLGLVTIEAGKWLEVRVPAGSAHPGAHRHRRKHRALARRTARARRGRSPHGRSSSCSRRGAWPMARRHGRAGASASRSGPCSRSPRSAIAVGSTWTLVQIGEAGSRAVWEGSFSDVPLED